MSKPVNIERYLAIAEEAHTDDGWSTGELADIIETVCDEVTSLRASLAAEREEAEALRGLLGEALRVIDAYGHYPHPGAAVRVSRFKVSAKAALAKEGR